MKIIFLRKSCRYGRWRWLMICLLWWISVIANWEIWVGSRFLLKHHSFNCWRSKFCLLIEALTSHIHEGVIWRIDCLLCWNQDLMGILVCLAVILSQRNTFTLKTRKLVHLKGWVWSVIKKLLLINNYEEIFETSLSQLNKVLKRLKLRLNKLIKTH